MFCGKCGSYIHDDWTFCMNCGARRSSPPKSIPPAEPIDRAAIAMDNIRVQPDVQPAPARSPRRGDREVTVASDRVRADEYLKTRVYQKWGEEYPFYGAEDFGDDERNPSYHDGYTNYYGGDEVKETVKHPMAAYIVTLVGFLDLLLIFLAYSNIKFNIGSSTVLLKDFGVYFLFAGAAVMLAAFIMYAVHRSRWGLNILGATGMIISLASCIIILVLFCLALYSLISTSSLLDLPALPSGIDVIIV